MKINDFFSLTIVIVKIFYCTVNIGLYRLSYCKVEKNTLDIWWQTNSWSVKSKTAQIADWSTRWQDDRVIVTILGQELIC